MDIPGSKAVGPAGNGPIAAIEPGAEWHYITATLKSSLDRINAKMAGLRNSLKGTDVF